jgi:bifunctional non-homologous end joining protein LigD
VSKPLPLPMLAVADDKVPRDDDQWAFEMKWDGYRGIIEVSKGRLRVASRRGNEVTARYPELEGLPDVVGVDAILDGEIVVLDDDGRASFQAIQQHLGPAVFVCFDVLRLDGKDVTSLEWRERRALVERLGLSGDRWQTSPVTIGGGDRAYAAAGELGFEGIVAKRLDSPYVPGRRSPAWRKVKIGKEQEFVVGGWMPGDRRLAGTVGSLLVGYYDRRGSGPLRYAGRVGSGFTDQQRDALERGLVKRDTSPFEPVPKVPRIKGAVWVEPDCVAQVRFTEWTSDGILRQPVFLGLRDDKDPTDVVRET